MIMYVTCKYIKYTIKKTIRTGILEYLSTDDNDEEFYYEENPNENRPTREFEVGKIY